MILRDLLNTFKGSMYKNALFLILNSLIMSGLGFIFWAINARIFNSDDVGLALTLISSMTLITTLSIFGLDDSIIKFLSKANNKKDIINSIYSICTINTVIFSLIFVIFIKLFAPKLSNMFNNVFFNLLFILFVVLWTLFVITDGVFISLKNSKYVLIKNFIFSTLKLVFPFILVSLGYIGIFSSWIIALIITLIIVTIIILKKFKYTPKFIINFKPIKNMLIFTFSNYVMRILLSSPGLLLPLIITNFLSPKDTAYFYMAWIISESISVIPNSIATSLFAETSTNDLDIKEKIKKALKFSYLLLIPTIIFIIMLSKFILGFFGEDYIANSLNLLIILIITSVPFSLNSIFITLNKVKNNSKKLIFIGLYFFIVFLTISWLLINKYGITGIGIGWFVTNLIFSFYAIIKIKNYNER